MAEESDRIQSELYCNSNFIHPRKDVYKRQPHAAKHGEHDAAALLHAGSLVQPVELGHVQVDDQAEQRDKHRHGTGEEYREDCA